MVTLPFMYRGIVEQLVGTDGRCRVRVHGLYDNIPTNELPICEPALGLFGSSKLGAGATLPEVGMWVWIFFDGGNIQSPVYFAYAPVGSGAAQANIESMLIDLSSANSAQITLPGGCSLIISDGSIQLDCSGPIIIRGSTILLN